MTALSSAAVRDNGLHSAMASRSPYLARTDAYYVTV